MERNNSHRIYNCVCYGFFTSGLGIEGKSVRGGGGGMFFVTLLYNALYHSISSLFFLLQLL